MALAAMSISGTKISSHWNFSPMTAMPGTRRSSMIEPASSPSSRHGLRQLDRACLVAIDDGLGQWVHLCHRR